jgi:hypothetical protein
VTLAVHSEPMIGREAAEHGLPRPTHGHAGDPDGYRVAIVQP